MAIINLQKPDPTLEAIYTTLENEASLLPEWKNPDGTRNIGASVAGYPCNRRIWYYHKGYPQEGKQSAKLKFAADDGYRIEEEMANRLRKVKGIELITLGEDAKQLSFKECNGLYKGKLDGVIRGLIQAPSTWHVWECKCVNQKKYDKFGLIRSSKGEKQTLKEWDFGYYVQAQIYMNKFKMSRHYLTVTSPGGREMNSCRTEFDKEFAEALDMKVYRIINSKEPMQRVSSSPKNPACTFCQFKGICFAENT